MTRDQLMWKVVDFVGQIDLKNTLVVVVMILAIGFVGKYVKSNKSNKNGTNN